MTSPLQVNIGTGPYQAMIGVGGIGSGMFFALNGDHTLGREESRGGHFLDRRDYCKLHIIAHYVKALLGPDFTTIPIGRVGQDDPGRQLYQEMAEAGLVLDYVQVAPGDQTLFSFCFIYPDGSGGNMTTDDSACARVDGPFVARAAPEFRRFSGRGVALAAPEVPLAARQKLLALGGAYGFFRAASFLAGEIGPAMELGLLEQVDLLALNRDEAAAAAGLPATTPPDRLAQAAVEALGRLNPAMAISITAGQQGSWAWDGRRLADQPALPARVASTAGAGDAHLAGIIAGLAAGLSLAEAQELGALVAGLAVTSPHTINKAIDRHSLQAFAAEVQAPLGAAVTKLLQD